MNAICIFDSEKGKGKESFQIFLGINEIKNEHQLKNGVFTSDLYFEMDGVPLPQIYSFEIHFGVEVKKRFEPFTWNAIEKNGQVARLFIPYEIWEQAEENILNGSPYCLSSSVLGRNVEFIFHPTNEDFVSFMTEYTCLFKN